MALKPPGSSLARSEPRRGQTSFAEFALRAPRLAPRPWRAIDHGQTQRAGFRVDRRCETAFPSTIRGEARTRSDSGSRTSQAGSVDAAPSERARSWYPTASTRVYGQRPAGSCRIYSGSKYVRRRHPLTPTWRLWATAQNETGITVESSSVSTVGRTGRYRGDSSIWARP